jgi:hypothetical protein
MGARLRIHGIPLNVAGSALHRRTAEWFGEMPVFTGKGEQLQKPLKHIGSTVEPGQPPAGGHALALKILLGSGHLRRYHCFGGTGWFYIFLFLGLAGFADIDSTLEICTIFDTDALRYDVPGQRAFVPDINPVAGIEIATNLAEHHDFPGGDVGGNIAVAPNGDTISRQGNRPFDFPIDEQRF